VEWIAQTRKAGAAERTKGEGGARKARRSETRVVRWHGRDRELTAKSVPLVDYERRAAALSHVPCKERQRTDSAQVELADTDHAVAGSQVDVDLG
jgi:hypothetical protein